MTGPFPFPTRYLDEVDPPGGVHPTEFYSTTDPALDSANHVRAGKRWRKTDNLTTPTWFEVYVRNAANSAWILERAWVNDTYAVGEVPVADADGRLAPGTVTPGAHAVSHEDGGDDELDVTTLAGFPGGGTTFLRDDGTFAAPPGGSGTVDIEDEGSPEGAADTIDFVGSGVSVTFSGGTATVDIPGGAGIDLEDEGVPEGTAIDTIDFVGSAVTVTDDGGGHATVTISAGGVSLVRATFVQANQSISEYANITLSGTPADGNWLVWLASSWSSPVPLTGGSIASDTHRWQELVNVGGDAFDGIRAWYRRVRSADSATVTPPYPTGTAGQNAVCFEVAGGGGPPVVFDWLYANGDTQVLSGVVLNDVSFMVGMFSNTSNSADDPTITGGTASVTEGTRATGTTSNGSPRQINPFYCNCEKGAETITANYAAAQNTIAVAVVFPPALEA